VLLEAGAKGELADRSAQPSLVSSLIPSLPLSILKSPLLAILSPFQHFVVLFLLENI